jgi:DNA-binding XRE family transcriptional regulator
MTRNLLVNGTPIALLAYIDGQLRQTPIAHLLHCHYTHGGRFQQDARSARLDGVMPVAEQIRGLRLPRLREWRIKRLMTQDELAKAADVTRGTVIRAEKGEIVSFANVRNFAKALNVDHEQLY